MGRLCRSLGALCVLAWTLWPQPAFAAKRALVIGNGSYRSLPRVAAFAASAAKMRDTLTAVRFQVDFRSDLDQAALITGIREFTSRIGAGDIVLVFYSGYGMQSDNQNYLVPVDYNPKDTLPISARAVSLRRLLDDLGSHQAGQRLVVLDAAWDCPGLPAAGDGLANVSPVDHTLILFSTTPGTVVNPPASGTPSRLTNALVKAIQTPGLKLGELVSQVSREVARVSEDSQKPYGVFTDIDDFYFTDPLPTPERVKIITEKVQIQPGESRNNQKDLLNYVWIPPGKFRMGCVPADRQCKPDEKPQHEVQISKGFFLTESEIPLSAYQRFLDATGHAPPARTQTNYGGVATEVPQTQVTWQDAQDYCKWAGGRLPSEAEWEYAARGGQPDQVYPWGNKFDPERANSYTQGQRKRKARFKESTPVRFYPKTGWNLFDIVGNVREWVADGYDPQAYAKPGPFVDPLEDSASKDHVARGGSYNGSEKDLRISARDHWTKFDNQTGFRCLLPEAALKPN